MGRKDDFALYTVARMRGLLERPVGKCVTFLATGFWVGTLDERALYVTNKHNVDPSLKHGAGTAVRLTKMEIEWRPNAGSDGAIADATFYDVANLKDCVWTSDSADCAMLVDPVLSSCPPTAPRLRFPETWLADAAHFARLQLTDVAGFIGYPGIRGKPWFDTAKNIPIARTASIASIPSLEFNNEQVRTADAMLVSGMSFSGSSGSPVFNERKGIPPGGDIHDPDHVASLIIGIMSGHWWEDPEGAPEMFRHSGLSYLTRTTSIRSLIDQARAKSWRH